MKRLVIFASGGGSNAKAIYNYFQESKKIEVVAIFCNKENAGIVNWAQELNLPCIVFNKTEWNSELFLEKVNTYKPSLIILAGFLWLVPNYFIKAYENRILNIHPSLLPKYGGKGMYGHYVHEAVIANNEKESGLTIHVVNEEYDKGKILHQQKVKIMSEDDSNTLAEKILKQEHIWYAKIIENYLAEIE